MADANLTIKSANFLVAWSKASGFDMTLMFCEDSEKEILKAVYEKLTGAVERLAFDKVFGSL